MQVEHTPSDQLKIFAHELRGPLVPLKYAVAIIANNLSSPSAAARAIEVINRQLLALEQLITDALVSPGTVDTRATSPLTTPVDIVRVVELAVDTHRANLAAHGHAIALDVPHTSLYVMGDAFRLNQVLQNLLTNASKYCDCGGQIVVEVTLDADAVLISIGDDGIGICAADLESIFDLYAQAGQNQTLRSECGRGIGLYVARQIVVAHNGTISASSAGLGQGSTFTVKLPLSAR